MVLTTLYFQLHQPFRLNPSENYFLWDSMNREVFEKVAEKCYIPATEMFTKLIEENPDFKITFSMSGTMLEQAKKYYKPDMDVITPLQRLFDAGQNKNQVEFLDETSYHSLTSLFKDQEKKEFIEQVSHHRDIMKELFGYKPKSFRNTELIFNNEIAQLVEDMGYKAILTEKRQDLFKEETSPNTIFKAKDGNLIIIPRNRELSDDVAFRFPMGITIRTFTKNYAKSISKIDGEAVMLGYDYEHIGEHIWKDRGIFKFWSELPKELAKYKNIQMANPTEIAEIFKDIECPRADIPVNNSISWADEKRDTHGWLGNNVQKRLFKSIQDLEQISKSAGGKFPLRFKHLTTSDNLYFLHGETRPDGAVHSYFSPYENEQEATLVLANKVTLMQEWTKMFEYWKQHDKIVPIIISPETDRLPATGMGDFAQYVLGKSGGMGEVVAALFKGFVQRGIPAEFITLNLKEKYQKESRMSEKEWIEMKYSTDSDKIHLINSSYFEYLKNPYDGQPPVTAARFQEKTIDKIKELAGEHGGNILLHLHDWMAGGVIAAYAKSRGIPVIHTIHNTHTARLSLSDFKDLKPGEKLAKNIWWDQGMIDAQATAIMNADKSIFVGREFMYEVVKDYFLDRQIIPQNVREATKKQYAAGKVDYVMNGISPNMFPENQNHLPAKFNEHTPDIIGAKKQNLVEFQKQTGLNIDPEAILFFWASRLDPGQKGVDLFEATAYQFLQENPDAQIAVVGDPIGNDRYYWDKLVNITLQSNGRMTLQNFNHQLSTLGYAAASDSFGASLYEPFGQNDIVGNIYGATATNRDTGGYHDKINILSLKALGAPHNHGNGFLFKDYDPAALKWGLEQSLHMHRFFRKNPDIWNEQVRRIIRETKEKWSLDNMVAGYIEQYEKVTGRPLY